MNDKAKQFANLIDEVLVLAAQSLPDGDYEELKIGVRDALVAMTEPMKPMRVPDPLCTLCDLGAPPHRTHGLSAKFEPHGMANVPSGKAMLLDGPAPTPKQEEYIRRETLEVAAQYLESLKLTGAHECAEVVRGLKAKKQIDECAGCQICKLQAQVTHQQEANKRYAWLEAQMRQQARIESEM